MNFLKDAPDLRNRRVTVMGLGTFGGGEGLVRFLVREGARVIVSERGPADALAGTVARLRPLPVTFHLDGHREEHFDRADLVVVNPAVRDDAPFLDGLPLETEINLFLKRCRARRIIGVTGSNGKTTTTALIGACLRRLGQRTWVGGNIGRSLLPHLHEIQPDHVVVLELSSFQLERMRPIGRSPHIAVITNLTPNHLDRHPSFEAYRRAKQTITAFQDPQDWAVINADDPALAGFVGLGRRLPFSSRPVHPGVTVGGDRLNLSLDGRTVRLDVGARRLRGRHNLMNLAAAAGAVRLAFPSPPAGFRVRLQEALVEFAGVEHRLEWVGRTREVDYYNDSIATTPESTLAALEALENGIILIAGGSDKGLSFETLAAETARRVRVLVLIGSTAPALEAAVRAADAPAPVIVRAASMNDAVRAATDRARPNDQILLSPACASYDMFRNFVERGRAFKAAFASLQAGHGGGPRPLDHQ